MTPTPTDEELRQDLDSWHLLPWTLPKWPAEPARDEAAEMQEDDDEETE